jgi:hypothetical protein
MRRMALLMSLLILKRRLRTKSGLFGRERILVAIWAMSLHRQHL